MLKKLFSILKIVFIFSLVFVIGYLIYTFVVI